MILECLVWQNIKIVVDCVERKIAKNLLCEHGIGHTDYRALRVLSAASNSELRMQELANTLGLNQSSVTRLVERLEKGGYTTRDLCPKDKRGVYTVLTERGRVIQNLALKDYDRYLSEALDVASSHKENKKIVEILRQLISHSLPTSEGCEH